MVFALTLSLALLVVAAAAWLRTFTRHRAAAARHQHELETLRNQHDTELRMQVERTIALFNRMVEGVIITQPTGAIRLANRAAGEIFGFTAPATGLSILEATRHHGVAAIVAKLDQSPEIIGHELTLESAKQPRHLQINALSLRTPSGERDGAIIVFHDLTALRRLESVRQEFVANVSHELRTPLSLIKSAAETLIDGAQHDPTACSRFLEIIDKHANRLSLLIDDLLLLSSLDSGRLQLKLRPVPLRAAVQEVVDELQSKAAAKNSALENKVDASLAVQADSHRLHQILINLMDNAIKYGREAGHTSVQASVLANGRIEIAVQDDGPGLPPEAKARVFERFYRVDKARSRDQGGTGLGLAIVKHVVQAHGGEVRVESTPNAGSTFFVSLPPAAAE